MTRSERLVVLEQRVKEDGSGTNTNAAISKVKIPVQISPRYGTWDPSTLSLTSDGGAGLPSFVRLPSSDSSSAASAG